MNNESVPNKQPGGDYSGLCIVFLLDKGFSFKLFRASIFTELFVWNSGIEIFKFQGEIFQTQSYIILFSITFL